MLARSRCGGACPAEGRQPRQRRCSGVCAYDYLHPPRRDPPELALPWLAFCAVATLQHHLPVDFGRRAGDMLGLGSLTLPSAFARLGWVFALVLMGLCCAGTLYSGRLFTMLTLQVRTCSLAAAAAACCCRGRTQTHMCSSGVPHMHCRLRAPCAAYAPAAPAWRVVK